MAAGIVLVYITAPDSKTAERIAKKLIEKRLIACANIFPIKSMYWWKGKAVKEKEMAVIAKTTSKCFEKMKKEVEKIHPYSVPCILKISAKANPVFFEWMKSGIKKE